MASTPRRSAAPRQLPILAHAEATAIAAYRGGVPVTAAQFARDVMRVAKELPAAAHVLNFCSDRYRFAVALAAALVRGQLTLLPPTTTPNVIAAMKRFASDVYCVSDAQEVGLDLPRAKLPELAEPGPARGGDDREEAVLPAIASDQVAACVFTSGSTGEPQPHHKTWGSLVADVRSEARRLGITPRHAILATVPPQHMYGLESTVLMPMAAGAALTAERLYYPADIDEAIARLPAPRVLVTTPFHLRTWMEHGDVARLEMILSATAPLSVGLARTAEERTGAELLEIYGCTETGQIATRRPTRGAEWELHEGVRLTEREGRMNAFGAHVEQPTPLQDVIELVGDGSRFLLHGRSADMVNIAGKRNSLGYLNHQLTSIPGVADGVFFVPEEARTDGVTRLMAFVVAPGLTAAEILAALRSRIDSAFLPRPVVMVDALPRALTGKLPRESLARMARECT